MNTSTKIPDLGWKFSTYIAHIDSLRHHILVYSDRSNDFPTPHILLRFDMALTCMDFEVLKGRKSRYLSFKTRRPHFGEFKVRIIVDV